MSKIHVISENDLIAPKLSGRRMRARCHFHYGTTRTLSIAAWYPDMDEDDEKLAGWGYCHNLNCHVVVLVQEWNPKAASNILGKQVHTTQPKLGTTTERIEHAEKWQQNELAALDKLYATMQQALQRPQCLAYLAGRGLGNMADVVTSLGIGYIAPANEWKKSPPALLSKWCDRLIFPFTTAEGHRGYLGRTLHLWKEGMDENQHKQLLDVHNDAIESEHGKGKAYKHQVRRWEKTYKSGFFHAEALATYEHITIVEGPFDAIPLIASGKSDVVAIAGTHVDIKSLPISVFGVTLGFDADTNGKAAMTKVQRELARKGITPQICTPPADSCGKDWSERYRLYGKEGLAPLLAALETVRNGQSEILPPTGILSKKSAYQDEGSSLSHYCSERMRILQKQEELPGVNVIPSDSYEQFVRTIKGMVEKLSESTKVHWTTTYTHQRHLV